MRNGARHMGLVATLLAAASCHGARADQPASNAAKPSQSVLLGLPAGAQLIAADQSDDDEATLPNGPYRNFGFTSTVKHEGRVTRDVYAFPGMPSSIAVVNRYRDMLKGAGFDIVFQCEGHDGCGGFNFGEALTRRMVESHPGVQGNRIIDLLHPVGGDIRYVLATLRRPQGRVTLALAVAQSVGREPGAFVETVEQPPSSGAAPPASAGQIAAALRVQGHFALYGLHFQPQHPTLLGQSPPLLGQVAAMLLADPAMRLIVVDHTDASEPLEQALPLSSARAQAVLQALVKRWKVPAAQLAAFGAGPAAPIASNTDEAGRALNRRIELVLE